jgi:hypothetical protein
MQVEQIGETVKVRVDFAGGVIRPLLFRRGADLHRVTRVHARWEDREGQHKIYLFSVGAENGDVYQLRFHTGELRWILDSVMMDG